MLTLTNPLTIEGFTVYHDDQNDIDALQAHIDDTLRGETKRINAIDATVDPDAHTGATTTPTRLAGTPRFYVLPDHPSIASDANGKPIFSLIVYRLDDTKIDPTKTQTQDVGGGILTFTTELAVPAAALQRIKSRLNALVAGSDSGSTVEVDLSIVDFIDGTVSIAIAGEGTADTTEHEFVKTAVGSGKIVGVADNRKAVMVKLTQEGAALMSSIEKLRTLPINLQYSLTFEHRLLGVTMRVWCDVSSSYHLVQESLHTEEQESSGYGGFSEDNVRTDKITSATQVMITNKTAGVEVIPYSSAIDSDTLTALEKQGQDMLNKELDKIVTASPPPATVDQTYLDKYFSDISSEVNFTVDRRMVLTRNYTPSANVANVFQRADLPELVAFVDLRTAFFALLKVPIRVNADFTKLPVSSVVVTVSYRSRTPNGSETRTDSFEFTDGAAIQTFVTFANSLSDVAYDWWATVHYKDSQEPFVFRTNGVKDTFLVVDVGTMGMIAVDISLGLVDLDQFPEATVSVRYQSRALGKTVGQSFRLSKSLQDVSWTDIIREESSGTYEYKVDWLRKSDSSILAGTWQPSTSTRLMIDAPVADRLTVTLFCSGNFKDDRDVISHVVVNLHYADPDNNYTQDGSIDFTDDKQTQVWTVDLRNPEIRGYTYRYSIIYKGGLVKNFPPDGTFFTGQPGFITVGEKYGLEVNVYPYLLAFGDKEKVVQVDLTYDDPTHGIHTTNSFVFNKDNSKPLVWRVRTNPAGPATYTADVSYFSATGEVTKLPTVSGDGAAFVVLPLHTAPATTSPASPHG